MNDPLLVRRFKCFRNLLGNAQRLIDGKRPACDPFVEALAVNEFKHQELRAVGFFKPMDLRDVRMVEGCEHLGCAAKRATRSGSLVNEAGRIFSATARPSFVSFARYTFHEQRFVKCLRGRRFSLISGHTPSEPPERAPRPRAGPA